MSAKRRIVKKKRTAWQRLNSDRGIVFLEAALVLPIFFTLMALCLDMPRIMTVRQRLMGANRLVSEIKARNDGVLTITNTDINTMFFGSSGYHKIQIVQLPEEKSVIREFEDTIDDLLGDIIGTVANFLSMGTFDAFFKEVVQKDVFYAGYVTTETELIIPKKFYGLLLGIKLSDDNTYGAKYVSYMPNTHTSQVVSETFTDKLKKIIPGF